MKERQTDRGRDTVEQRRRRRQSEEGGKRGVKDRGRDTVEQRRRRRRRERERGWGRVVRPLHARRGVKAAERCWHRSRGYRRTSPGGSRTLRCATVKCIPPPQPHPTTPSPAPPPSPPTLPPRPSTPSLCHISPPLQPPHSQEWCKMLKLYVPRGPRGTHTQPRWRILFAAFSIPEILCTCCRLSKCLRCSIPLLAPATSGENSSSPPPPTPTPTPNTCCTQPYKGVMGVL